MAKRVYTDDDKGTVYAALQVYDGNVKRTSRSTGIPEQTVRDWKKLWEKEGPSQEIVVASTQPRDDFVEKATRLRDKAMAEIERALDAHELKGQPLINAAGMLHDKITLAKGGVTQRTETTQAVDPEAIGAALMGMVQGAISAAQQRAEEIVDADFEEQTPAGELPPATT